MNRALGGLAALAACAAPLLLPAVETAVWEIAEYRDFLAGRFDNVSLDRDGRVRLAPKAAPVLETEDAAAWTAATGPDGRIYVGTGHGGRLYVVERDGKSRVLWTAPEIEIFAVAVAPSGAVYAGTSPNGKVYRVEADGRAEPVFDPKQAYIWALRFGRATDSGARGGFGGPEALYVATGDEGKIFRLTADGKSSLLFDSGQRHAISLALDSEGRLLAGTDPNGILYRIEDTGSGEGRAFALYDSDLPEIRAIDVAPDGSIRFAAMGGAISLRDQTVQAVSSAATISVTATASASGGPSPGGLEMSGGAVQQSMAVGSPGVSPGVVYYGVETAAVYRLDPGLSLRKLWTSKEENVLALTADPAEPDSLLFATDNAGRLYRLRAEGAAELLSQTDRQTVTALVGAPSAVLVAAAHGGALLRLAPAESAEGVYETGARDAGGLAAWGRLDWEGQGTIAFETRSGNSARPDASWSEWSKPIDAPGGGPVASPPARYLQWRARLKGSASAPRLDRVRVSYLPRNEPPVIESISVKMEAAAGDSGGGSSSSGGVGDSAAAYSITVSASGDSTLSAAPSTAESSLGGGGRRALAIGWTARDPNNDKLVATVEFRGEGETAWKSLRRDVKEAKIALDSDALADGRYRFRVRVSDSRSNPPATALESEKTSEPVLIDHTPPAVKLLERTGRESLRFEARDAASSVVAAEYSIDGGPWTPIHPEDGVADSPEETFLVPLIGLEAGEHLVTLRARDRAGNVGLGKALVD